MNSIHVHANRNDLPFVGTAVHDFVLYKRFSFCFGSGAGSEGLLPDETYLHTLDLYLDEMEVNSADDDVFEVVEGFVVLKINMKALVDPHLHFHRDHLAFLDICVRQQDSEVVFFSYCSLIVAIDRHANKVSNSARNPVESLIFLLEIRKLKFVCLVFRQYSRRLEFFGE